MRLPRSFTLLEVLLATTLSAVIALAVASVFGTQVDARRRLHRRADRRSLLSSLERRLRADLRSLVPPGGTYASGLIGEDAVGTSGEELLPPELLGKAGELMTAAGDPAPIDQRDRLTMAVLPPAAEFGEELPLGEGALWEVVYEIDDDPETLERGLIRRVARVRDLAAGVEPDLPEEIAPQVVAMNLRFFDGQEWQETWDSSGSDTLPTSTVVELVLVDQGELLSYRIEVSSLTGRLSQLPEAGQ